MAILSGFKSTVLLWFLILSACGNAPKANFTANIEEKAKAITPKKIVVAANKTNDYLPLLKGKKVAIVANQTSVIFKTDDTYTHIVDSLQTLNVDIKKVFAPEHGFRGKVDA
ncbi:MAG: exo-beta-N-acetylmuramidase NamZ domain-containing protein, partial [Cellulophaga sp.]|uniref:exo-beta-N-acetylmuramidase NamZ domain-containing protein n=1 Tax=Cellulophaga sp. TaxID=1972202 RepID=UPI003267503C